MATICFIDCEFTNFVDTALLSLGAVALDGTEHYVELDLGTDIGIARRQASSDFVAHGGVLAMWGRVPGATVTYREMGRRTGEWLLNLAASTDAPVEVAFDYQTDVELLQLAIADSGHWDRVRDVVRPINVSAVTSTITGELAAEECYRLLRKRGLHRHHALADALALRAGYVAAKDDALALTRFAHMPEFRRLLIAASGATTENLSAGAAIGERESWLRQWLMQPA